MDHATRMGLQEPEGKDGRTSEARIGFGAWKHLCAIRRLLQDDYTRRYPDANARSLQVKATLTPMTKTVDVPKDARFVRIDVGKGVARAALDATLDEVAAPVLGSGIVQDTSSRPETMPVDAVSEIGLALQGDTTVTLTFW